MTDLVIDHVDFESITTDICTTYVGEEAVVLPAETAAGAPGDICAHVAISGDVSAVVMVECDDESAADVARRMFALDPSAAVDAADVADALGEIANVIGGNVKSLASASARLSLPRVGSGPGDRPRTGRSICCVDVVWDGGRASVSVCDDVTVRATAGRAATEFS